MAVHESHGCNIVFLILCFQPGFLILCFLLSSWLLPSFTDGGTSPPSDSVNTAPPSSPMMGPVLKRRKQEEVTPSRPAKSVVITHQGVRDTTMQQATTLVSTLDGFTDAERLKLMKMLKCKFLDADMLLGAGENLLTQWLRSEMSEYDKV